MNKKNFINLLKIFFIALFSLQLGIAVFFTHIHIADGKFIKHVHIFDSQDSTTNEHSDKEMHDLEIVTHFDFTPELAPYFDFIELTFSIDTQKYCYISELFNSPHFLGTPLRGPPCLYC